MTGFSRFDSNYVVDAIVQLPRAAFAIAEAVERLAVAVEKLVPTQEAPTQKDAD